MHAYTRPIARPDQCGGELWQEPFTDAELETAYAIISHYTRLDGPPVTAYMTRTAESPWQTRSKCTMAKKPTKAEKAAAEAAAKSAGLLASAVNALNTNQPFMATESEMDALLKDPRGPLVEFNPNMRNGEQVAFRATQLGVQAHNAATAAPSQPSQGGWGSPTPPATGSQGSPQPAASSKTFTFDTNIALPAPRRGGRGSAVYGFEQMNVGQSFYIPATTDNPNPAKRIASTVSSATKRLDPKKFVVRSVDETQHGRGKGARVWRTA